MSRGDPGTTSHRERPLGPRCLHHEYAQRTELLLSLLRRAGSLRGLHPEQHLDLLLDLRHERRIILEEHFGVLSTLSDTLRTVAIPRTGLVDNARLGANVDQQ